MKCECGRHYMQDRGDANSPMAIVVDYPLVEDYLLRPPVLLGGRAGDAMKIELANAGMDFNSLHVISYLPHPPSKDCEVDYGKELIMKLSTKKVALVMGNSIFRDVFGMNGSDWYGLEVQTKLTKCKMVACPAAYGLITMSLGEYRIAFGAFSRLSTSITTTTTTTATKKSRKMVDYNGDR